MKQTMDPKKVVVFSGAGISAESGIPTFRDAEGLWRGVDPMQVASAEAWARDPETVLEFYAGRIHAVARAEPNAAHRALAELESEYEVVIVTQNVDDLHERAGSKKVIHIHGSIVEARVDGDLSSVHHRGYEPIRFGEVDDAGRQLRPNIVLFGEEVQHYDVATAHFETAGKVLVVGTSLQVYPAAGLLSNARSAAEKVIVAREIEACHPGYKALCGNAGELVPTLVRRWLVR